ncbi:hypothetical protein CEXT_423981 [Caerostris extrusa]|uniref:Uncharacterized protein n=1 Tax=Caerostris extrusa TaxID=172846 RepID=A0AAV4XEU5_CAEEX|nr:hypothetical protein CEXT_423981 [Caerostris extrusa]
MNNLRIIPSVLFINFTNKTPAQSSNLSIVRLLIGKLSTYWLLILPLSCPMGFLRNWGYSLLSGSETKSDQFMLRLHIRCMKIFTFDTTGSKSPMGSNIVAMVDKIFLLSVKICQFHTYFEKKIVFYGFQDTPSFFVSVGLAK